MKQPLYLLISATLLAGCASQNLHTHAKKIDAVQLSISSVETRARFMTSPTLDMELLETMAMEPVFAVGKAGVLEKNMSQPAQVRQSMSESMNETIKSFPIGQSVYSLDSRVPLYGFVHVEDERAGRFFVVVSSTLVGPEGQLWRHRVLGVSPKTSYSAVANGELDLQEGLRLAIRDANEKVDSALQRDSKRPQ